MTKEQFGNLVPRKSLIGIMADGKQKVYLLKFFLCNKEGEYHLLVTEDFDNPSPEKAVSGDLEVCYNQCEYIGTRMTGPEAKALLLKDLAHRLPYGVKCKVAHCDTRTLVGVTSETSGEVWFKFGLLDLMFESYPPLPYLRPLSDMTDEEKKVYYSFGAMIDGVEAITDWLCKNHFDWRGLIKVGLALPATRDMYFKV